MQEDIKSVLKGFSKYLLEFAHFIIQIGELEAEYSNLPDLIGPEAVSAWTKLGAQFYQLDEKEFVDLMRTFYKIAKLPHNIEKLPSSEKITFGKELESHARKLLEIVGGT